VDGAGHLLAHVRREGAGLLRGQHAVGDEPRAEPGHRIAALGGLVLLDGAEHLDRLVLGEVQRDPGRGDDVAVRAEPVDLGLHQRRPAPAPRPRGGRRHLPVHRDGIAAVDGDTRHAVGPRLDRQRLARRGVRVLLLDPRDDVVAVVLHHVDDRQLPQRRDVERLVERALLGRAVAEEAQHHLALPGDLRGVGGPGRLRYPLPHDAGGAEEAPRHVGEVHRPAVAPAQSGPLAEDLGHHRIGIRAEDDRVAVAAVGGEDLVAGPQGGQGPDDRRLSAIGQMRVAPEQAGQLGEAALNALLELPDAQHLREHPHQAVLIEALLVCHLAAAPPLAPAGSHTPPRACPSKPPDRSDGLSSSPQPARR
jgi:hypothetical protein